MRLSKSACCLSFVFSLFAGIASAQSFVEYPVPTPFSTPEAIGLGPDGAVWFLEKGANKVGRVTLNGTVTEYVIPSPGTAPFGGITAGPDNAMWFTEDLVNKIGRITPAGTITEFTVPTANSLPYGIVQGADHNLWFIEYNGNKVATLTPTGTFTEFPIPTPNANPVGIGVGPNNTLWVTEYQASKIARVTLNGVVTEFPLPHPSSGPAHITAGPDGNLWFTEDSAPRVGRITPSGVITEFNVPGVTSMRDIVAAPDGNLYFTVPTNSKIGRVTTAGVVTLIDMPAADAFPTFLTVGADGNLWIAEGTGNKIAVLFLQNSAILPAVASAPGALGSFFRTSVQLHNATASTISGKMVFHGAGHSGADTDPSLPYSLAAGQTTNIPDVVAAIGQTGLGSIDVVGSAGPLPTAVARVFNDAGANGTTGFTEEMLAPNKALSAGDSFSLIVPADLARFRLNIGVRTLGSGASIEVTEVNSAGSVVRTVTKTYDSTFFQQVDATSFLGGAPAANDAIEVKVVSGSLFIYGATTDNTTQDPSIQLGHK
jgi:streptogramin lyase